MNVVLYSVKRNINKSIWRWEYCCCSLQCSYSVTCWSSYVNWTSADKIWTTLHTDSYVVVFVFCQLSWEVLKVVPWTFHLKQLMKFKQIWIMCWWSQTWTLYYHHALNYTNPSSCICRHFLPHSACEHVAIKNTPKYGSCEPKLQTFEAFVRYNVYLWSLACVNLHANKTQSWLIRCYKWLILKPVSYFPHQWTPYEHFTTRGAHPLVHDSVYFHMLTLTLVYKVP